MISRPRGRGRSEVQYLCMRQDVVVPPCVAQQSNMNVIVSVVIYSNAMLMKHHEDSCRHSTGHGVTGREEFGGLLVGWCR